MSIKIKLILVYLRIPLLLFAVGCILLIPALECEGDIGGMFAAIFLFLVFPGFLFTLLRAIYLSICTTRQYNREGWPEKIGLPEVEAGRKAASALREEVRSVKSLSPPMRWRYFLFRLLGVALIVWGIVIAFMDHAVIGALIIIAGATFWLCANPSSYNKNVDGVKMVPCDPEMDVHDLYDRICHHMTALGSAHLVKVLGFQNDIIAFGPDWQEQVIIVYRAAVTDCFYVSSKCAASMILEELTEPEYPAPPAPESLGKEDYGYDINSVLYDILGLVESAVAE